MSTIPLYAAAGEVSPIDPALAQAVLAIGLTVAGLVAAIALRLWRPGLVRGPGERLPAAVPAVPWLLVVMAAGAMWILSQSAYVGAVVARDRSPATQATSPPTDDRPAKIRFTAKDLAILSTIPPAVASAVLILGGTTAFPGLLRRLGFAAAGLPRAIGPALAGLLVALPLVMWTLVALQWLYARFGYAHPEQHEMLQRLSETSQPITRVAIVLGATVAAPVFEELLFRGGVQTLLRRFFGGVRYAGAGTVGSVEAARVAPAGAAWGAILLASALFASIHEAWMAPAIFVLSVCLGYAYERTGNLWVPVLMHAIFNTVNVVASLRAAA